MKTCQLLLLLMTSSTSVLAQSAYVVAAGLRTSSGQVVHDVTSGSVTFNNERKVTILDLHYDGTWPKSACNVCVQYSVVCLLTLFLSQYVIATSCDFVYERN